MSGATEITMPIRVVSEANRRDHWAKRYRRMKAHHVMALVAVKRAHLPIAKHYAIHMERIGGRQMDTDNLAGAFKAVRDGVAHALGIDDAPRDGHEWTYSQRARNRGEQAGCVVTVRALRDGEE